MPSYVNSGTRANSSGATTRVPALPSSRSSGNLIFAVAGSKNNYVHTCSDETWNKYDQLDSGTGWTFSIWWRIVDGSEAAPTITVASSNIQCFGQTHQISGPLDTASPFGASNKNAGSGSPHTCTGINTTRASSLVVYLGGATSNTSYGAPGGSWTEHVDNGSSTGATRNVLGSQPIATSGAASGNLSITGSTGDWVLWQIELLVPEGYVEYQCAAEEDTATSEPGNEDLDPFNNDRLYLYYTGGSKNYIGCRWQINIPAGATILSAYVQFNAATDDGTNANGRFRIGGWNVDSCDAFNSSHTHEIPNHHTPSGTYSANATPGTGTGWKQSEDISQIVQEFIDRAGYVAGSSYFGCFIDPNVSSVYFTVYNGNTGANAPKLIVTFEQSGGELTKDLSDTLALGDARLLHGGKVSAESLALADARAMDMSMRRAEAIVCSDALTRFASRTFADQLAVQDVGEFSLLLTRLLTEVLALGETRAMSGGKQLTEFVAVADILSQFSGKAIGEILRLTDTRVAALQHSLNEVLKLSDAGTKLSGKELLDVMAAADVIAKSTGKSAAEILALDDVRLASLQKSINDLLALADTRDAGLIGALQLVEALTLVDVLSRDTLKPLSEHLQLSDERLFELRQTLLDQLATTDSRFMFVARSLSEIVTLRDQLSRSAGKNMTEQLVASESLSRLAFIIMNEVVSLSDAVLKSASIELPEDLSLSDLIEKLHEQGETLHTITLIESLLLLDSIRKDASILREETFACADALAKRGEVGLADVIAVAEFLLKAPALVRLEQLYASDALNRAMSVAKEERLQLNDILLKHAAITLDDLLAALDAFSSTFVDLYGIIRLLSLAVQQSQISNLLFESSMLDLVRFSSPTLNGIRLQSVPALVATNMSTSQLTSIRLEL